MNPAPQSPAEIAAADAQQRVDARLDEGAHFRLEAGAGAGKTYSLVKALKRLISTQGTSLLQRGQRVACITFTEVARDEIARDIEMHPAILVETIHAFSWAFMMPFQSALRELVGSIENRQEKIEAGGGIGTKPVTYDLGFFGIDEHRVTLSHDDIPSFMACLLERPKFRAMLNQAFPVIFIDEYQDTDPQFMAALTAHLFAPSAKPQIGLFGDHWQTIYRNEYTLADFPNVEGIGKQSNFRSAPAIVDVLNRLRPELPQHVSDPAAFGEARFFHVNSYAGERTNTAHSKADLPDAVKAPVTEALKQRLIAEGWDFAPEKTKVLMLTHNALAAQQGYPTIAAIFDRNEAFAKKEDPTIAFLADTLEPMMRAFAGGHFGEMFRILGGKPPISRHANKVEWRNDMDRLNELRAAATVGDVLDHLKETQRPRLPDKIALREEEIHQLGPEAAEGEEKYITRHRKLRAVPYSEVVELVRFLEGHTPFATQHSVKGAEFENVLVLLGGGWNHYNWPNLMDLLNTQKITDKNTKGYHRARNLFYVAISRPKVRLAVLATQTISQTGLAAAADLFGADAVIGLTV